MEMKKSREMVVWSNGRKQSITEWRVEAVLGAGSFGQVFLAQSLDDGQLFALKTLPSNPNPAHNSSMKKALQNELLILQNLNSPHVVPLLGAAYAASGELAALFLEYVSGGTLRDLVAARRLTSAGVAAAARQILQGLAYLHSRGVTHGDVKCQNVLVDAGNGAVKIADFGSAVVDGDGDVSVRGTLPWMAPEVLSGKGARPASDVWSLGCSVVEMLTGRPPISWAAEPASAILRVADGQEDPVSFIQDKCCLPDLAMDFVRKCLRHDPESRWTAAQLLLHPFVRHSAHFVCPAAHSSPRSILNVDSWFHTGSSDETSSCMSSHPDDGPWMTVRRSHGWTPAQQQPQVTPFMDVSDAMVVKKSEEVSLESAEFLLRTRRRSH